MWDDPRGTPLAVSIRAHGAYPVLRWVRRQPWPLRRADERLNSDHARCASTPPLRCDTGLTLTEFGLATEKMHTTACQQIPAASCTADRELRRCEHHLPAQTPQVDAAAFMHVSVAFASAVPHKSPRRCRGDHLCCTHQRQHHNLHRAVATRQTSASEVPLKQASTPENRHGRKRAATQHLAAVR